MVKLVCCVLAVATACGSETTPIPDAPPFEEKPITTLETGEITLLCESAVATIGPERTLSCPGTPARQYRVGGTTVAVCVTSFRGDQSSFPDCTSTVAQYQSCIDTLPAITDSQICDSAVPGACQVLRDEACVAPTDYVIVRTL